MTQRSKLILTLVCAIGFSSTAEADFRSALQEYVAGHYEQARTEFLSLAELEEGAAQWNLAAMSFKGQGTPRDMGAGVGWVIAAAENGCQGLAQPKIDSMRAKLSPAHLETMNQVLSQYGRQALLKRVLPDGPTPS